MKALERADYAVSLCEVVLAIALLLAPFFDAIRAAPLAAGINVLAGGVLLVVATAHLLELLGPRPLVRGGAALCGAFIATAPWVFSFSHAPFATSHNLIIGGAIIALELIEVAATLVGKRLGGG